MSIEKVLKSIPPSWKQPNPEDYIGEDGLLWCGKCHTPKQCKVPAFMSIPERVVNCACDCRAEEIERRDNERKVREQIERLTRAGLSDPEYHISTFENDDRQRPKLSDACKRYCAKFAEEYEPEGTGIVFYGPTRTGKTYFACCIANELIANGISAMVTSLSALIDRLQSDNYQDRDNLYNSIRNVRLLVIDDLGVESQTPFRMEVAYRIIDARCRSGRPLIVTTNMTKEQMTNPASVNEERILKRILERCKPIQVSGESHVRQKFATVASNAFGNASEMG